MRPWAPPWFLWLVKYAIKVTTEVYSPVWPVDTKFQVVRKSLAEETNRDFVTTEDNRVPSSNHFAPA